MQTSIVATIIVIVISILLVIFNLWRIKKKYYNKNSKESSKVLLFKDSLPNIILIFLGFYFAFMVLGWFVLINILMLLIGLLFIIHGSFEMKDSTKDLIKYGRLKLLTFLIIGGYSLFEIFFGIILVYLYFAI